jgi:hypothetical protein
MLSKITGVRCDTVLDNREVSVFFRSPYRYRVVENGRDVTKDFGGGRIEQDSPKFRAFHEAVSAGERKTVLKGA